MQAAELSIGFRATSWNGTNGFITAAHGAPGGGAMGLRNGDRVAVVVNGRAEGIGTVRNAALDGVDAAFVELDPGVAFLSTAGTFGYMQHRPVLETIFVLPVSITRTEEEELMRLIKKCGSGICGMVLWFETQYEFHTPCKKGTAADVLQWLRQ